MSPTSDHDPRQKEQALAALRSNYLAEKRSAQVYRELAQAEPNPQRRDVLKRMAEAEERHADRWAAKLAELGETLPTGHKSGGWRSWLNRALGMQTVIRRM